MVLELENYNAVCEMKVFSINGVKARYYDFGEKYDAFPDEKKPSCCGDMVFKSKMPSQYVLDKYSIDSYEYDFICGKLEDILSYGTCRLCV